MAEQRTIKTKIWSDHWFLELKPEAKLLFLFFTTNRLTQISGYYEVSVQEMVMYTGLTLEKIKKTLPELEPSMFYQNGWVAIKNYSKHQNYADNEKIKSAIERQLKEVPESLLTLNLNHKSKSVPMDRVSIPYKNDEKVDKVGDKDRKKYGEFKNVLLTDEEKVKLKTKYGVSESKQLVEELSTYIKSKGVRYKDHYATILAWARKKGLHIQNQETKEPKMIPETVDGKVRFIPNPNYHE